MLPGELRAHPLWWTGPPWLKEPTHRWPTGCLTDSNIPGIAAEERAVPIFNLLVPSKTDDFIKRFSSLDRLKRVTAYCLRFHHNARTNCTGHTRQYGSITANELRNALICLVRMVQSSALHIEKEEVKKPKTRHHLVRRLALFLDQDDILRVGGRLSASGLTYEQRHPALIPKSHEFTKLVIDHAHKLNLHAGALSTHAFIRQSFWILDGRNVTRRHLVNCNRCYSCKPQPVIQPMRNLPTDRFYASAPFHRVGVDYAGPFHITTGRVRGAKVTKAYICAFVCFSTKAVHLELASDLSTVCFLAAYRRFISRRGNSTVIFSDNGTNFVGAHRELNELSRFLATDHLQTAITAAASSVGTDWRFIPPSAPHFTHHQAVPTSEPIMTAGSHGGRDVRPWAPHKPTVFNISFKPQKDGDVWAQPDIRHSE